jgi:hypothetical protein
MDLDAQAADLGSEAMDLDPHAADLGSEAMDSDSHAADLGSGAMDLESRSVDLTLLRRWCGSAPSSEPRLSATPPGFRLTGAAGVVILFN